MLLLQQSMNYINVWLLLARVVSFLLL